MAASYQVSQPELFDFTKPEEWPKWLRRFERFRQASGLVEKTEEVQVNTLLYCMGDQADDIFRSFKLSDEDAKKYSEVKSKFEEHFVKRRNVIFERARFNCRKQEQGEPVDTFITALYALAEHCNYGALHDEMIRDKIVVGIRDASLSEKLQLDADLTLTTAVAKVRQAEAVKKQQPLLRGETPGASGVKPDTPVGAVQRSRRGGRPVGKPPGATHKQIRGNSQSHPSPTQSPTSCSRCGRSPPHDRQSCSARDAICRKCSKRGHFQVVCRSSSGVKGISEETNGITKEELEPFLGGVDSNNLTNNPWRLSISLNSVPVEFDIDTGAEVSVISESGHKEIGSPPLSLPDRRLKGPSNRPLPVTGCFTGVLKHGEQEVQQEMFVVKNLCHNLLGRPAINALELAVRVGAIFDNTTPVQLFPRMFQGLGKLKGEYEIKLKNDSKPHSISVPRRVAIPLMGKVRDELEKMERLGVIAKVHVPTDWCAGMVVVPKPNGTIRICVDLTKLNQSVCRERHPLPAVEQTLAQLAGAQIFTKLDANSGFWQIPLSPSSALLTTFLTPFGRYCFHRLPFGITSAPEHFQRRMSTLLDGLDGVVCLMDDILVHGATQDEHDNRLMKVLRRLETAGITLNKDKCEFSKRQVKFLGQVIDTSGVRPDTDKVRAIQDYQTPTNVGDVRRFLGMVNQLSKFSPHLAEKTRPLRELLQKDRAWLWSDSQQRAFEEVKKSLTTAPLLSLFDPTKETVVSADASSYGLGAVLLQRQPDGGMRPISYNSRSMSPTEQRYAQIEKEALALTWACERFSDYLVGLTFTIETDHKPLVPLFSYKNLDELPLRVQRFRMRMMRFSFSIHHIPGRNLTVADALSRAPLQEVDPDLQDEADAFVNHTIQSLPATEGRLEEIRQKQRQDDVCRLLVKYSRQGWPDQKQLTNATRPFFSVASELSIERGLLLRGGRIVVPTSMRKEVLEKLHAGHQGIVKCRARARQSVWWPGISAELQEKVASCQVCSKERVQNPEPLIPSELPELPFQKVGTDLFEWEKRTYLLLVDYYSRFIEIALLGRPNAAEVINHLKSIFARHGIPETVVSDNGPQYSCEAFADFAREYQFQHITSSPGFPQSNGEAERAVKTIKNLLKKERDPYMALLSYRATPLQIGYSPSEMLMGRRLRTTVPTTLQQLTPKLPDRDLVRKRDEQEKERQERNFNKRHRARELPALDPGDIVWVPDRNSEATVQSQTNTRSYEVETNEGLYRRNRQDLIELSSNESQPDTAGNESQPTNDPTAETTIRRSTRTAQPPDRLDPSWK